MSVSSVIYSLFAGIISVDTGTEWHDCDFT